VSGEGPSTTEILDQGVEPLPPAPATPSNFPAAQRRDDPAAVLSGPGTSAAFNAYFSEILWAHRIGDDAAPETRELRRAFEQLGRGWSDAVGAYLRIKSDPDPTVSDYGRRLRISNEAGAAIERAAKLAQQTLEAAEVREAELKERAAAALRLRAPESASGLAAEIRTYLRSLKPEERHAALERAIRENDAVLLNAAFSGPSYLSGFGSADEARFALAKERALAAAAPEVIRRIERHRKARELVKQRIADVRAWSAVDFKAPVEPSAKTRSE
jgi:hypothetical protein